MGLLTIWGLAQATTISVPGLDPEVLELALDAMECARKRGELDRGDVLSVIDFRLPSTERRLWVIDLRREEALFVERVAHGRNTGDNDAVSFSNRAGSNRSSVGLYRTGETYVGKHGRSLRLDGLEPGFNDNARSRAIVVHAAGYATLDHVMRWGRLGRSEGCPALDPAVSDAVIDAIRDGTLLFAYYPEPSWLEGSRYLSCS
ncbi:MAG: murein L,D-transpeptidase catalytic domain family protein [Myxococcota bacterium]